MSDGYVVTGNQVAVEATPGETIMNLFSPGTTRRGKIYYISLSADGSMADQLQSVQIQRTTALGTEGAGVVPAPVDPDAPPATLDGGEDHSVEPTFAAATELWQNDVHLRALAQIQLQPDGHLMIPATLNAGIGARSFSSNYVGGANTSFHYME